MKFYIKNKVLDQFLVDMKQKEMLNNTMFRMDQRMDQLNNRMDQLQSQMDALYKAIGG